MVVQCLQHQGELSVITEEPLPDARRKLLSGPSSRDDQSTDPAHAPPKPSRKFGPVTIEAFSRRPRRQVRYTLLEEMKDFLEVEPVPVKPLRVIGGITPDEERALAVCSLQVRAEMGPSPRLRAHRSNERLSLPPPRSGWLSCSHGCTAA